jgi:hypothetical protein
VRDIPPIVVPFLRFRKALRPIRQLGPAQATLRRLLSSHFTDC